MRVLVTGGAGYIGSHTAKVLSTAGHEVVVLDSLETGHRWAVQWGPLVEGDVGDSHFVQAVLAEYQPEAVIHFAANAYVGESMKRPEKYFRNNAVGTLNLLEAVVADGVRPFVFSSSCAVYGLPEHIPIAETESHVPVNPYGESKLMAERALRWHGDLHGLPWIALRYFNAAGADPEGELGEVHVPETHLIPNAIAAATGTAGPMELFGSDYATPDGTAVRDYVHVTDLATAHLTALDVLNRGAESRALNLGTGTGYSVRQVVQAVADYSGGPVPTTEAPRRVGDPPILVADPSKAAAALSWTPEYSDIDTIIATSFEWTSRRRNSARSET